ncbi:MAG: SUF system NifU family Fe-S cluster assembly protein [Coriobacteriia bacterium]|nr:SUF system NifU family Fe-S cluster assembly protein [Coriobacteriia bacterium]MBS5478278.1 SUF system NifU family Fe-S cluster assembly protein [Coriobacteriia bacterium]
MTDLYSASLIEHNANPDYKYEMEHATCEHMGVNPTCGDELKLQVRLADDGTIAEASFTGHGCAVSQASADMMADAVIGLEPEKARELCHLFGKMVRGEESDPAKLEELGDAECLQSVSHMPSRVKCAELAWRTLDEMLGSAAGSTGSGEATTTE